MKIYCRVTDLGLIPKYDSDGDEKHRLKVGEDVLVEIKRPRNYEFHKKFFALIRLTFDNLPERLHHMLNVWSEEDMLVCIKLDLGLASTIYHGGRECIKLGSISFAAMDNDEFERFYNRALDLILRKYLRGTTREQIAEEIQRFY